jgi:aspartate 1-decarboxylase
MRIMLKSKIHRARITDLNIGYEGSITIDCRLMEEADILPYEQVQVVNINNGARFETYAIGGEPDSGQICINGAAARLAARGDTVIILSYCHVDEAEAHDLTPRIVHVDTRNRVTDTRRQIEAFPF